MSEAATDLAEGTLPLGPSVKPHGLRWDLQRAGSGRAVGAALASGSVEKVCWRPDGRRLAAIDAEGGVTA